MIGGGLGQSATRHHAQLPAARLQALAARTWLPADTADCGGWLLRAAGGWTGRANSALALGDPAGPLDEVLHGVRRWYAARGLPALVQAVAADGTGLGARLERHGWRRARAGLLLTCSAEVVLGRAAMTDDRHQLLVEDAPSPPWLDVLSHGGGPVPPAGLQLLRSGPAPQFLSLCRDGAVGSIARVTTGDGWTGVTAVRTRPDLRRTGLAQGLLRVVATRAREADAADLWLGVDAGNAPALALYRRCGFTVHHRYDYWQPPAGVAG